MMTSPIDRVIDKPTNFLDKLLSQVVARLLGSAARAADLVADEESRLVMLARWTPDWRGYASSRHFLAGCRPFLRIINGKAVPVAGVV